MWQWFSGPIKARMPSPDQAPKGRAESIQVPESHFVLGTPLDAPFLAYQRVVVGMGCFWGAEKKFWQANGVYSTAAGYAGGYTPNPTYYEVCSGLTGHTEAVQVIYDQTKISFESLLQIFWENHDPTQGMRQGNDVGTEYRSAIYTYSEDQLDQARKSKSAFQAQLNESGFDEITTEILPASEFYFADHHHQQYLAKNPGGYCGLGGTGVSCPIGPLKSED